MLQRIDTKSDLLVKFHIDGEQFNYISVSYYTDPDDYVYSVELYNSGVISLYDQTVVIPTTELENFRTGLLKATTYYGLDDERFPDNSYDSKRNSLFDIWVLNDELSGVLKTTITDKVLSDLLYLSGNIMDLSGMVVELQNEDNVIKQDISLLSDLVSTLHNYDDTDIVSRIETLENKEDKDTIYDDTNVKEDISVLSGIVSGIHKYDDTQLKSDISLLSGQLKNDIANANNRLLLLEAHQDQDTIYDDTQVKSDISSLSGTVLENYAYLISQINKLSGSGSSYDSTEIDDSIQRVELVTSYALNDLSKKFNDLSGRVTVIAASGESYDDTQVKSDISVLSGQVAELQSREDKDTVYDDTKIKSDISTLSGRVANTTTYDDSSLSGTVAKLSGNLSQRIELTYYYITQLSGQVSNISSYDDSNLSGTVATLSGNLSTRIDYVNYRINNLSGTTYDDSSLSGTVAKLSGNLSTRIEFNNYLIRQFSTETWTFTLADGTTVTKNIVVK